MIDYKNPNYTSVFAERVERLNRLRKSPEKIPIIKAYYRDNIGAFTRDWGCTYDPRNVERGIPAVTPFIPFAKQQEWLEWLMARWRGQEDGLTEKSRDMGLTWLSVAASVEMWLFHAGISIGFGSRKEGLVDRIGDPDSIFERIRMFIRLLPLEFLPVGRPSGEPVVRRYNESKDATFMKIINIENGSSITGEAGDNIGRGGRKSIYFKDESAFYDRPLRIDAALSQTSNCKIDISTPNGAGNAFYQKRFGGTLPVFTFHWRDDPRKDDEWLEKQKEKLDSVTIAQEIEIDYSASIEGVCIPGEWVQAAINLHEKLGLNPSGATRCGFDVADEGGKDSNCIASATGMVVDQLESWNGLDTHQSAHRAGAFAKSCGASWVNYDATGVGAGVRGSSRSIPIPFNPVFFASTGLTGPVIDNNEKLNRDHYVNLRAQLYWEMRVRCQRASQHLAGIVSHSLEDMISLPNHPALVSQLSQPRYFYSSSGKIQIESKDSMKKRGVSSPNEAEAVILLLNPPPKSAFGFRQIETIPRMID